MKNNSFVSIILPVYNEEKYLDKCLSSLLNQSYKNLEIIVIDDGSTDKSKEIIKNYKVKYLDQKHLGPGAARNKGIKKAKGEIIVLADADMYYDRNYVKKIIEPIIKENAVGTFTKEEYVANSDNIWSVCWSVNSGLPKERRLPKNYKDTENAFRALKKGYFLKAGGYNTNEGYIDDSSLTRKSGIFAINAPGAISYHFNPSTLWEVFLSSRWIGRSLLLKVTFANFFRYSILNSLRIGIKYFIKGAPLEIIIFKVVHDFGIFNGIFIRGESTAK